MDSTEGVKWVTGGRDEVMAAPGQKNSSSTQCSTLGPVSNSLHPEEESDVRIGHSDANFIVSATQSPLLNSTPLCDLESLNLPYKGVITECSSKYLNEKLFPQLENNVSETLSDEAFSSALEAIDLLGMLQDSQLEDFVSLLEQPWHVEQHVKLARMLHSASLNTLELFVLKYNGFLIIDRWLALAASWASSELGQALLQVIEKLIKHPQPECLSLILDSGMLDSLRSLQKSFASEQSACQKILIHLKFLVADSADRRLLPLKEALMDRSPPRKREFQFSEPSDDDLTSRNNKKIAVEFDTESDSYSDSHSENDSQNTKVKKHVTWANENLFEKIEFYKNAPVRKIDDSDKSTGNELPRQRISWHKLVPLDLKKEYTPIVTEATHTEVLRESNTPPVVYASPEDIPDAPRELPRPDFDAELSKYESTPYPTEIPFSPISQPKVAPNDTEAAAAFVDYKNTSSVSDLLSKKPVNNAPPGDQQQLLLHLLDNIKVGDLLNLLKNADPQRLDGRFAAELNGAYAPFPCANNVEPNIINASLAEKLLSGPVTNEIKLQIISSLFKTSPMRPPASTLPPQPFSYNTMGHHQITPQNSIPSNIPPNGPIYDNAMRTLGKLAVSNYNGEPPAAFDNSYNQRGPPPGTLPDPARFFGLHDQLHPNDISPTLFQIKRITKFEDINRHLCKNWRNGSCTFGAKCHFLHYWPCKSPPHRH